MYRQEVHLDIPLVTGPLVHFFGKNPALGIVFMFNRYMKIKSYYGCPQRDPIPQFIVMAGII